MSDLINFSWKRTWAITVKEFIKIKLDPTALAMILAVPILQVVLFGYSIEFFPKKLPTAVVTYDSTPTTRRFIQAIEISNYFKIIDSNCSAEKAQKLLKAGKVNYILTIPKDFSRKIVRGDNPHMLLEADASSPGIMGGTIKVYNDIVAQVYAPEIKGPLNYLKSTPAFTGDVHAVFNPRLKSTHSIIPSLIGVILMISLSLLTSMTIIEERDAGNIEVLLNTRIKPLEIMIGKFLSYLLIGYIQLIGILIIVIYLLFDVPMRGSVMGFILVSLPFIMCNIMIGLAASTVSQSQVQAQQIVSFFFLPSLLLSGFLFPFYGMPAWAQFVGDLLPLTHYMRISSGIMIKNYDWFDIYPELWPILVFAAITTFISIISFRKTLD